MKTPVSISLTVKRFCRFGIFAYEIPFRRRVSVAVVAVTRGEFLFEDGLFLSHSRVIPKIISEIQFVVIADIP